jgi:hypothetical protein
MCIKIACLDLTNMWIRNQCCLPYKWSRSSTMLQDETQSSSSSIWQPKQLES